MIRLTVSPLDITVVGAGSVGQALGANLVGLGHRVRYAVRASSDRDGALRSRAARPGAGPGLPSGSIAVPVANAAHDADLVLLAVPFGTISEVVPLLGLHAGSVLVDATNPFGQPLPDGRTSGASIVVDAAPAGVHVVKAFNVLGAEHMHEPGLPGGFRPLLPVAADDPSARDLVAGLAADMGFDAVEVGDLSNAGLLEEAARYWGLVAFAGGRGRTFALVAHQRSRD